MFETRREEKSREQKRTDDSSSLGDLKLHLSNSLLGDDESCSNIDAHDEIEGRYWDVLHGNSRRSLTSVLKAEEDGLSALSRAEVLKRDETDDSR